MIVVTGGAGFLGSHLCDRLLSDGNEVICLDNFFTGTKENIRQLFDHPYFELIRHDIVLPILLEVDRIYHLACPASPIHYQYNPVKTIKTNIIGTLNMSGYCASKFAMNGWSESLYHELKPLGVNVSLVCPGPVSTQFNREFVDIEPKSPPQLFINAEAVSQAVMRAIEKNQFEVIIPRWLALMCAIKRFTPSLFRVIAQRRFRSYVTKPARVAVSREFPANQ